MVAVRKLSFKNVNVTYGDACVLKNVSGSVSSGHIFAVVGPSGCGKTTLLNVIYGVLSNKDSGSVDIEGVNVLPGDLYYAVCGKALIDSLTLKDNLRLVQTAFNCFDKDVEAILKRLKIDKCLEKHPVHLSSGEYKRALIACGLVSGASFLLLDEPTSNLDEGSSKVIASCLKAVVKTGDVGIIVATHDPMIMEIADSQLKFK